MRAPFVQKLLELAARDDRICLLTGDLGYLVVEPFIERFPDRFFNMGVAEQNMVGVATGLAESGYLPFVYSIVTFASMRPYEFIRNGPVAHHLPVRIIAVGGGFDYGTAGPTHHGLEDLGLMRLLDGLTVIAPADHVQAVAALDATYDLPGPVYYRLGKDDKRVVSGLSGRFRIGRGEKIRDGQDLCLVATGSIAAEVAAAAEALATAGIESSVLIVSCLSPPPIDDLIATLREVPLAVTVEVHRPIGGLGSLVAEVVAGAGIGCRVERIGAEPVHGAGGSDAYLLARNGLSLEGIVATARDAVAMRTIDKSAR